MRCFYSDADDSGVTLDFYDVFRYPGHRCSMPTVRCCCASKDMRQKRHLLSGRYKYKLQASFLCDQTTGIDFYRTCLTSD